jgi:acyl-CoA thioesterase-1
MHCNRTILIFAIFFLFVGCTAEKKETQPQPPVNEHPSFSKVTDTPGLPRVLLIGDSISMGYTLPVREKLQQTANVHRIPTNGGPTTRGVESIDAWLGDEDWDLIHFNWGLHDLKIMDDGKHQVPLPQYKRNLRILVQRLKQTGAQLIWCSTTPVPKVADGELRPPRRWQDVIAYNEAAAGVMHDHDIPINDLYAFALPRLAEIQRPKNVHFTQEGSNQLAEKVAQSIQKHFP